MPRRLALIIGNSIFRDPSLARLLTPDADVGALADVLLNPEIGAFDDVKLVVNMSAASIRRAISHFFSNKTRDDLLLLYFSGHGVLDENGRLYLATKETERDYLRGTAIPAAFLNDEMDNSRSRRQILVLDCCHSGAFARGSKGVTGASVGTAAAFEGKGYGRVVLTASDATQYAWEGDRVIGEADNSVFTHYLVQGLQTGQADADGDGRITVDELYDYAYEHVISQTPKQTPGKWSYREQGEIVLARTPAGPPPAPEEIDFPEFDDEIETKLKRLYDTGLAAYWLDDWDRAARAFQAVLDVRPDYPGALENLREARRNAELARLYQTAQDALESQDWDAAVSALEALLAQEPDYRDAAPQLQTAREQSHLANLYAQARRLHQAEEWYAARRVLANIAEIDPDYPDEDGLTAAVDENIAALEHRKKLEDLYSRALARIDSRDFARARDLLSQIQELEPGYAETEGLLARVESLLQKQADERQRQERAESLYRQAQDLAQAEQWPQVLAKMQALRQITPEFDDPQDLLATAQRQIELAEPEPKPEPGPRPEPAPPDEEAQPWYSQPVSYLREHIWLTLGGIAMVGLLVWAGLNAPDLFPSPPPAISPSPHLATATSAPEDSGSPPQTEPPPQSAAAAPEQFECLDSLGCVTYGPGEPIRLAAALVLSGEIEHLGLDSLYGIEIAIVFRGEILGHPIDLQVEDSGCTGESGQAVAQTIVSDPSILGVIGSSCSSAAVPMSAILSDGGYFMVSPSNTAPPLTDPELSWNPGYLRTAHNDIIQGHAMAEFATQALGVSTAALIHDGDIYTESLANSFFDAFIDRGGRVVEFIAVDIDAADMRPALAAISAAGPPEIIYYPLFPDKCTSVTRQARQMPEFDGTQLASADGCISSSVADAISDVGEGMFFSGPDLAFESQQYERFLFAYRDKYGTEPLSVFHAHAFDATNMVLDCIEQVSVQGSDGALHTGRQDMRQCLYDTRNFNGLTGNLTCQEFGDCSDPRIAVSQLQSGEFVRIWP